MRLARYHGLGNDYLVLEDGPSLTPDLVRALCDRHWGVGSDGVLEPSSAGIADYGVFIWNPDGSQAEKSGNGLRIFAHWLVRERGASGHHRIWTGFEEVTCDVRGDVVTVDMGRARFTPEEVPVLADAPVLDQYWYMSGAELCCTVVGVGNPHCVVFVEQPLDTLPWRTWGRALETDARFPNRTNVQVARILGPGRVEARIWERGAGETQASGSSSCAVAAAAVRTGRLSEGPIEVCMPGGTLHVRVDSAGYLRLVGPVERVGVVAVDEDWLRRRLGSTSRPRPG